MSGTEQNLYSAVGAAIREQREKLNLSQSALAELARVNRTSITNIESGRQRLPLHTLYRIARSLDCSARELLPERPPEDMPAGSSVPLTDNREVREFIRSAMLRGH